MQQCPIAMVRSSQIGDVFPAIRLYREHGITPNGKPLLKQAVAFIAACEILETYLSLYEKQAYEKWQRHSK